MMVMVDVQHSNADEDYSDLHLQLHLHLYTHPTAPSDFSPDLRETQDQALRQLGQLLPLVPLWDANCVQTKIPSMSLYLFSAFMYHLDIETLGCRLDLVLLL